MKLHETIWPVEALRRNLTLSNQDHKDNVGLRGQALQIINANAEPVKDVVLVPINDDHFCFV